MTVATWVTMIVIVSIVWGGFAFALRTALRKESEKGD
ncbi:MAG: MetS family NSS transporter small subunit [Gemmatimonadota bacterium]